MGKENDYMQRAVRLAGIIKERQELYKRVGKGEVKPEESLEHALKVGKVRERVAGDIERKRLVHSGLMMKSRAAEYFQWRETNQRKLEEAKRLVQEGHLESGIVDRFEWELEEKMRTMEMEPLLAQGMRAILAEGANTPEPIKTAKHEWEEFLQQQGPARGRDQINQWRKHRRRAIQVLGDEALESLVPADWEGDTREISLVINPLYRVLDRDGKRLTKSSLVEYQGDFEALRGIGEKRGRIVDLMVRVIKEERASGRGQE